MEQLNPHSVLVTGSNRGLGLELVKQLAKKSNPPKWIFATCRDPAGPRAQDLKNLAAEHPQIVIITMDTNDPSSIKAAAAKVTECLKGAGLNLLVNNAGIGSVSNLETETPENMAETYKTNVIGSMVVVQLLFHLQSTLETPELFKDFQDQIQQIYMPNWCCVKITAERDHDFLEEEQFFLETLKRTSYMTSFQSAKEGAFLPLLRKAAQENPLEGMSCSKAAIVNMSSEAGSITNLFEWQKGHFIAYRCSKCALNMLSKCQSLHLAEDEILCIALHPGWVQTDMGNRLGKAPLTTEQSLRAILNTLGRLSEKNTGTFVNWEGTLVPW